MRLGGEHARMCKREESNKERCTALQQKKLCARALGRASILASKGRGVCVGVRESQTETVLRIALIRVV